MNTKKVEKLSAPRILVSLTLTFHNLSHAPSDQFIEIEILDDLPQLRTPIHT